MIARARLVLLVSVIIGAVLMATEFPWHQILSERASVSHSTKQLHQLQGANMSLESEIQALNQPATIAAIAHSDYGLIAKGQKSLVVLPGGGTGGSGPLSSTGIPNSDVVPTDSIVASTPASSNTKSDAGFWGRLLHRVEFWKAFP